MLNTCTMDSDVQEIINALPADQIRHLSHVSLFVGILTSLICDYGYDIGEIDAQSCQYFEKAAFYHDLGKAWVPIEIISKPGKLTAEEFQEVKQHTLYANDYFTRISDHNAKAFHPQVLSLAHDAALYHHEWWNGQGYPYGLSENQIPLIARITSICDVYDAITSVRAYRDALTHEFACNELKIYSGKQFDPALSEIFIKYSSAFNHSKEILTPIISRQS